MLFLKGIVSLKEAYMKNKLYKSNSDKMVSGVCGGIAEYFNIDSTIVRLALVLFILIGGSGLLAYIICAIVIPQNPNPNY
jgi:phage shock protein C